MKTELNLVIGASGQIGSEIVKLLEADGQRVRATTSKQSKGTDRVRLDLTTGEGMNDAFEGVDRAFLMSPPPHADQYKILSPLIQEAKRRGLRKVVLLTAMGANAVETSPFRRAEIELEKSGLNHNIVRPNWFMQNFATFWLQGIKEQGKILLPAGTARTSFVDTKDVAAVIARLLTSDAFNNKAFDLTGPEALDHNQIARAISEVTGRRIEYVDIHPSELKKGLLSAGLPEDYTDFLLFIFSFLKQGYNAAVNGTVKEITGRDPHSFHQMAQRNKRAWI